MPHDQMGNLLEVGDYVMVPARVKEVYQGEEYCNVQLETALPMFPGDTKSGMTLNAKQVLKHTSLPSCAALDRAFENA